MRSLHLTANRLRPSPEWGAASGSCSCCTDFSSTRTRGAVAPRLATAGLHVYGRLARARRFGWVGAGGYYHFADYVADLDGIVRGLGRAALVAHSMGGNARCSTPARCRSGSALVSIEGSARPPPTRRAALRDLDRRRRAHRARVRPAFSAATDWRACERYPRMSEAALAYCRPRHPRRGRGAVWKFDPLHQTRSPQPYYAAQGRAFGSASPARCLRRGRRAGCDCPTSTTLAPARRARDDPRAPPSAPGAARGAGRAAGPLPPKRGGLYRSDAARRRVWSTHLRVSPTRRDLTHGDHDAGRSSLLSQRSYLSPSSIQSPGLVGRSPPLSMLA
jgi:hypothetical protein